MMLCFVLRVRTSTRFNSPSAASALLGAYLPNTRRSGPASLPGRDAKREHRSSLKALPGGAFPGEKAPRTRPEHGRTAGAALATQFSAKSGGNRAFLAQGASSVRYGRPAAVEPPAQPSGAPPAQPSGAPPAQPSGAPPAQPSGAPLRREESASSGLLRRSGVPSIGGE